MSMNKTEKLTQLAVMTIAVCAVVVSVWQVRISQEHNKLSVMPYLDYFSGWVTDSTWRLNLLNEGIGPAIIKGTELKYKGETYSNWDALLDAIGTREIRVNSTTIGENSPFRAEKEVVFFEMLSDPLNPDPMGVEVIVKYTSIYGGEVFEVKTSF